MKKRIFLAHGGRQEDDDFATVVCARLSGRGYDIFVDRGAPAGPLWAAAIDARIHSSDYFVVLMSSSAAQSETVQTQYRAARDASASKGKPKIVYITKSADQPVPTGFLPSPSGLAPCYLLRLDELGGQLNFDALLRPSRQVRAVGLGARAIPVPDGEPYMRRPHDEELTRLFQRPGQTVVLRGGRQTGKTSALSRAGGELASQGRHVIWLDFNALDTTTLNDSSQFATYFLSACAAQLDLEIPPQETGSRSFVSRITDQMGRRILSAFDGPVTLAIDNADRMFESPFQRDFFAMIRAWHNSRAFPSGRSGDWRRLDIAMTVAREPHHFISDPHQSPFNVGAFIRLEDFSPAEVEHLSAMFGRPVSNTAPLTALLGGHPFLVRRALESAQTGAISEKELLATAVSEYGPFGDHLRHYALLLGLDKDLSRDIDTLLRDRKLDAEEQVIRLEAAGLIKRDGRNIAVRCRLYEEFFKRGWAANA